MTELRSAIYYPHSRIYSERTIKHMLLLYDKCHIIVPWRDFDPGHTGAIAEAWSIIGELTVPHSTEQELAHDDIVSFIRSRDKMSKKFFLSAEHDPDAQIYEVYPDKLLDKTWRRLVEAGFAGELLSNDDRPMSTWGGLLVMAKLADACAGQVFARVTDQTHAYRAIADELHRSDAPARDEAAVVPVLLSMVDPQSIPLASLLRFRADERDPSLRHRFLDAIRDHMETLRELRSPNQVKAVQDAFAREMRQNLEDLRDALKFNRLRFVTSTAALSLVTGTLAAAATFLSGPIVIGAAIAAAGTAGLGVKQLTDFFGAGLDLSDRQRNTLAKHPMAYMHLLSRHRLRN